MTCILIAPDTTKQPTPEQLTAGEPWATKARLLGVALTFYYENIENDTRPWFISSNDEHTSILHPEDGREEAWDTHFRDCPRKAYEDYIKQLKSKP